MIEKKSPNEVIVGMIDHLIETRVRKHPYIAMVSKKQLWFGNGIWKNCEDQEIKDGLRANLGIKIPSDKEVENKNLFYGYKALQPPWSYMNGITNNAIRQGVLWEMIDGKQYSDIRIILGMGYVRTDGTLDPKQTKGMSCYVFFHSDEGYLQIQNEWIARQDDWVQLQILRNQMTHHRLLETKRRQATKLVRNNKKLMGLDEYKKLIVPIDRKKITWDDDE
jgi:hypothetical protein